MLSYHLLKKSSYLSKGVAISYEEKIVISMLSVAFLFLLVACGSSAVESGTYTGTVSAISADSIAITTYDRQTIVIPLTADTAFTRGGGHGGDPSRMGVSPSGDVPSGDTPAVAGQMHSGDMPDDADKTPSDMNLTADDIAVGDRITVVVGDSGKAESVALSFGGMGEEGGTPNAPDNTSDTES